MTRLDKDLNVEIDLVVKYIMKCCHVIIVENDLEIYIVHLIDFYYGKRCFGLSAVLGSALMNAALF